MDIEELAFKDRKNLAQLNELDLLDIIEFLQNDRKQWVGIFTKTHNRSIEIQKENQELKKQLSGTTFCYDEEEHRKLKEQQKEFIKYLEDEIKLHNKDIQTFSKDYNAYFSLINDLKVGKTKIEEILQKYKQIIGDVKKS